MIYNFLATIYDQLVADEDASDSWVEFVKTHAINNDILELACGSGEITRKLAINNYRVLATDLSEMMIKKAQEKGQIPNLRYQQMNMLNFNLDNKFSNVICFCDSINYLSSYEELNKLFTNVYQHLNSKGVFLFDMHHDKRIDEFLDVWEEEGQIDDITYQWIIESEGNIINQYFNIIKDNKVYQEHHKQHIFDLDIVVKMLNSLNFKVEVYLDEDVFKEEMNERFFIKAIKV